MYDFPNQSNLKQKILIKNLSAYKAIVINLLSMVLKTKKYLKEKKEIHITPFGVDINLFKNMNYINKR